MSTMSELDSDWALHRLALIKKECPSFEESLQHMFRYTPNSSDEQIRDRLNRKYLYQEITAGEVALWRDLVGS